MRVAARLKGSTKEQILSLLVHDIYDLDTGQSVGFPHRTYLVDEEGGYLERYKKDPEGRLFLVVEGGQEVLAWERIYGRFRIIWNEGEKGLVDAIAACDVPPDAPVNEVVTKALSDKLRKHIKKASD